MILKSCEELQIVNKLNSSDQGHLGRDHAGLWVIHQILQEEELVVAAALVATALVSTAWLVAAAWLMASTSASLDIDASFGAR